MVLCDDCLELMNVPWLLFFIYRKDKDMLIICKNFFVSARGVGIKKMTLTGSLRVTVFLSRCRDWVTSMRCDPRLSGEDGLLRDDVQELCVRQELPCGHGSRVC